MKYWLVWHYVIHTDSHVMLLIEDGVPKPVGSYVSPEPVETGDLSPEEWLKHIRIIRKKAT